MKFLDLNVLDFHLRNGRYKAACKKKKCCNDQSKKQKEKEISITQS